MGVSKKFDTPAMKRGKNLEALVVTELKKNLILMQNTLGLLY